MCLSELIEKLDALDVKGDDPEVYIQYGKWTNPVRKIEYSPETEEAFSFVLISDD